VYVKHILVEEPDEGRTFMSGSGREVWCSNVPIDSNDVIPTLIHWQEEGIELGIISNFDTRIYSVLEGLDLKEYFDSITVSSLVGAAKPDPQIFWSALEKHQCKPDEAWHIGDSLAEDYQGAIAVGLRAFCLDRDS